MAINLDISIIHEWLDAGGSPDDLEMWIQTWKDENPDWLERGWDSGESNSEE